MVDGHLCKQIYLTLVALILKKLHSLYYPVVFKSRCFDEQKAHFLHMRAIIELTDLDPTHAAGPRAALWEIIRVFKVTTSYRIRRLEGKPWFAWQDDYYDSVIRTEAVLQDIRQYFLDNLMRWSQDKLYRR